MNILSLACSFGGADVTVECPNTRSTYRFTIIVDRKRRPHIGGHFMAWGMTDRPLAFWIPYDVREDKPQGHPAAPRCQSWYVLNLLRASRDPWFADLAGKISRNYC